MNTNSRKASILYSLFSILPFVLPFYVVRFQLGPLPTTLLELYLLSLFAFFTLTRGANGWREGWQRLGSWRWPVAPWFAVTLLAVLISPDLRAGFGLWRAYVLEPLLVFIVLADVIRSEVEAAILRRSFFLTVPILALWALVQFLTGWGIPHPWDVAISEGRRAVGPFPYPNALALFVTPIAAWAFARWVSSIQYRVSSIEFLTWVSGLIIILLAKSDGGLVAFLVVAFIVLVADRRFRRWAIGIAAVALIVALAVPAIREPVVKTLTFQDWSGQVRLFQWRETREMLKDHPFFGAGFGGYPTVFKSYHKATAIEIFQYPHNILLNFWSETGILGVLTFGWIVVTWVRFAIPRPPLHLPLRKGETGRPLLTKEGYGEVLVKSSALLVLLIHGLVDVPYFKNDLAVAFWMLAFLTTFDPKGNER